ncbi:MAG TPA: AMP-binding protein [Kiritimatiellia bacterium]|jgi:phenylacetate-coenzyme A ligase PaaK-like adenylate-forming protein
MNTAAFRAQWGKMGRDEIRRAQGDLLGRYLRDHVVPFSAYYREVFRANKLDPRQFRSLEDLQRLPFIDKTFLMNTPEHPQRVREFALIPDQAVLAKQGRVIRSAIFHGKAATRAALNREYRPVFLTSTTGRSAEPVSFLFTQYDLENLILTGRHIISVLGATEEDRIINMFPYSPHLAFWQTHYATTYSTIFCVSTGGGKVMGTEGNIRLLNKVKPAAIIGMPTFLYHLLTIALEEGHRCESLRMLVLGGEKVPDGMRQKLRELAMELGAKNVDVLATYGFTEAKAAWAECPFPHDGTPGGYHLTPELSAIEIIDPDTGQVQPDGAPGEIVFSALDHRGTVVLRYRTGDCTDGGLVYEPCQHCKRSLPRIVGNISRKSNRMELRLDKIKGTLVDFNELEHALDDCASIGAWQLELRKLHDNPLELDELILHAEKRCDDEDSLVVRQLNDRFSAVTELRLNDVEFHDAAEMRRRQGVGTELKEKRIVDNRPHDGKPAPPRVRHERRERPHRLSERRTETL